MKGSVGSDESTSRCLKCGKNHRGTLAKCKKFHGGEKNSETARLPTE